MTSHIPCPPQKTLPPGDKTPDEMVLAHANNLLQKGPTELQVCLYCKSCDKNALVTYKTVPRIDEQWLARWVIKAECQMHRVCPSSQSIRTPIVPPFVAPK